MARVGWSAFLVVLGLVLAAGRARAEDVFGLHWATLDTNEPPPPTGIPDVLIVLQSVDDPPFEASTYTGPDGRFHFTGVPPGTYTLSVPFPPNPFGSIAVLDRGPPPEPPLPRGLFPVPPGESREVDLPFQQGVGPAFGDSFARNVVAGGLSFRWGVAPYRFPELIRVAASDTQDHVDGVNAEVWFNWGFEVWLTPLDPPGDPVPGLFAAGADRHRSLFSFPGRPLEPGDRVAIFVNLEDPLLADWTPWSPSRVELVYDPAVGLPAVEFRFGRAQDVTGRVFVDRIPQDGLFGGLDRGVGGLPVHIRPYADGQAQSGPRETVTSPDGTFVFEGVFQGYYVVEVETAPGAPPLALTRLVMWPHAPVPALFPLAPTDPGAPICAEGDLHEVLLATDVWVGEDPGMLDVRVRLANARHGHGHGDALDEAAMQFDGPFPGPESGVNGVVRIEDVVVEDGRATVVVRIVAASTMFPAGFFGDVRRALEVRVDRRRVRGCGALRCETVRPGSPWPDDAGCFRILDAVSWEDWNAAVPPPPCVDDSTDDAGGVNRLDLRVALEVRAPTRGRGHGRGHGHGCTRDDFDLVVDLRARRGLHDRVRLTVPPDGWEGLVTGCRGLVDVTRVEPTEDGTWQVSLTLHAPDRADGNPGALPLGSGRLVVDLGRERLCVDLRALDGERRCGKHGKPHGNDAEVLTLQSVADAGTCRRSGGS